MVKVAATELRGNERINRVRGNGRLTDVDNLCFDNVITILCAGAESLAKKKRPSVCTSVSASQSCSSPGASTSSFWRRKKKGDHNFRSEQASPERCCLETTIKGRGIFRRAPGWHPNAFSKRFLEQRPDWHLRGCHYERTTLHFARQIRRPDRNALI